MSALRSAGLSDRSRSFRRTTRIPGRLVEKLESAAFTEALKKVSDAARRHGKAAGILVHNDPRKVRAQLPPWPVLVLVDESKLALALTNVLSNAYKYSAKDRDIHLELRQRERQGRAEVGIAVIDQGMGMTPEQRSRLFERFFRADTSGSIPGTGLGMAIVKEIVDLLGGRLAIESAPQQGTTVRIVLPLAAEPAPLAEAVEPAPL